MDYKEKYEKALERAKVVNPGTTDYNIVTQIFPELKESEGERIRKGIIEYLEQSQFGEEHYQIDDDIVRNYITWLEKQGEQDPTKWSEEDERTFNSIIEDITPYGECPDYPAEAEREYYYNGNQMVTWLKSIKERMKGE